MNADLSLVIPAFNEQSRLPDTLRVVSAALAKREGRSEIIVVDDGSSDATAEVASRTRSTIPVRVVTLDRNRGKGAAVSRGVREADYDIVGFTDADCPYELEAIAPMVEAIRSNRTDVAIGARDLPESEINRGYGPLRYLAGKAFSLLTYAAIGLPFRDSQCGLKLFRRDVAEQLFSLRTIDGFGFDIETLAAAVAQNRRIELFPVRLTHNDDSRIRVVSDSLRMAADVFRVRSNLRRGAYERLSLVTSPRPCPLCQCEGFRPRAANQGFRMVECLECSLWYLAPMPTEASLVSLYGDQYYESDTSLRSGYSDYEELREQHTATFARRLQLVAGAAGSGRLLDVGAGFGYLLDAARDTFSERWALELSRAAAARISRDHRVVVGSLDSAELPTRHFDVLSMQDCLEHLPDPLAALQSVRRLLRPGGTFFATTPDVESWLRRLQGRNWVSLKFPEHVVLYSESTLRRALGEAGFRIQTVHPAGQYVTPSFLASRLFPEHQGIARNVEKFGRLVGGDERHLLVPSGSITFTATLEA